MNSRLSLASIAARLVGQLDAGTKVGTSYDRDYLTTFGKVYPAVCLGAQRLTRADDGRGVTGRFRQRCKVEIAARIVVRRYEDGVTSGEPALNDLHNAVALALAGWQPEGAEQPLVWESSSDGPPDESVMTADLIFSTTVLYSKAS